MTAEHVCLKEAASDGIKVGRGRILRSILSALAALVVTVHLA